MSDCTMKDQPAPTCPKSVVVHDLAAKGRKMFHILTLRETRPPVGHCVEIKDPCRYEVLSRPSSQTWAQYHDTAD
jgi:hypothetical protein